MFLKIITCIMAIAFGFFAVLIVRQDYVNYTNSQLVTAKVMDIEILNGGYINVTYQYGFNGKTYTVDEKQGPEKLKVGDELEKRIIKNKPETILEYDNINMVVFQDIVFVLLFVVTTYAFYVSIHVLINNTILFIKEEKEKANNKLKRGY